MNPRPTKLILIVSGMVTAFAAAGAQAALITSVVGPYTWSTDRANFSMLDPGGYVIGGTNDVSMVWDGNAYNSSSDYTGPGSAGNITMSSTTPFFGHAWTAHDIQAFVPGTYSFDTTLGVGVPESGTLNVTVGPNQLGMHMLFDWNGGTNNDIFVVFALNSVFGPGIAFSSNTAGCASASLGGSATQPNCLWDGAGYVGGLSSNKPAGSMVWNLASVDGNGDGIMGIPLAQGGPLAGFNANFNANLTSVPIPAGAWLFGSGLMPLVAAARRKKKV